MNEWTKVLLSNGSKEYDLIIPSYSGKLFSFWSKMCISYPFLVMQTLMHDLIELLFVSVDASVRLGIQFLT